MIECLPSNVKYLQILTWLLFSDIKGLIKLSSYEITACGT